MSDVAALLDAIKSLSAAGMLRETLGQQFNGSHNGLWPNSPEHAPPFRPDPSVPNPLVARMLEELFQIAPEARGTVDRVLVGPTAGSMSIMAKSGLPLDHFQQTDLDGVYQNREIGLNPLTYQFNQPGLFGTLSHEMTHAAGYPDRVAYPVGDTAEQYYRAAHRRDSTGSTPMNSHPFREDR